MLFRITKTKFDSIFKNIVRIIFYLLNFLDNENMKRVKSLPLMEVYGSFHIRLTVDVTDLNEIIFFRFFINNK